MSKAFIAAVLQDSLGCSEIAARQAAKAVFSAIIGELQREGSFTLSSFGNFTVHEIKARPRLNPATGAAVAGRDSRTVRFRASPLLKKVI